MFVSLPKPCQNRGGVASSSSLSPSIEQRAPRRGPHLLLRRPLPSQRAKSATSSAPPPPPPPPRLLPRTVPRASLWDSIFGGGGSSGDNGEAKEEKNSKEDSVLLDPGSLPACLSEPVLSRTFLAGRALANAYTASKDGWSALQFHEKCDFKGPSLVVAETTE